PHRRGRLRVPRRSRRPPRRPRHSRSLQPEAGGPAFAEGSAPAGAPLTPGLLTRQRAGVVPVKWSRFAARGAVNPLSLSGASAAGAEGAGQDGAPEVELGVAEGERRGETAEGLARAGQ